MQSSAVLFRRQGYAGTGIKQIAAEASAPFGSLYHFFPGGKEQLAEEVIRWSGAIYTQLIDAMFVPDSDAVTVTRAFFSGAAAALVETDYADACPIAVVALEVAGTNEPMRQACADVFNAWLDALTAGFLKYGFTKHRSRALAISLLASLEGALVLCRAIRSTEPLETAGAAMAEAVRQATPGARAKRGAAK